MSLFNELSSLNQDCNYYLLYYLLQSCPVKRNGLTHVLIEFISSFGKLNCRFHLINTCAHHFYSIFLHFFYAGSEFHWISAHDQDEEGTWMWSDGSIVQAGEAKWLTGNLNTV